MVLNQTQKNILWLGFSAFLALFFAPAWLLFFYILVQMRENFINNIEKYFHAETKWYVYLPLCWFGAIWILKGGVFPVGDVWRHITAYRYNYDYTKLYLYFDPAFPKTSMWIGFEWLTGHLHRLFDYKITIHLLQATALLSLWVCMRNIFNRILINHPEKSIMIFALLVVVFTAGPNFRITLARPEVFFTIWMVSALWLAPRIWIAIGIAMQPLYWLSPLYFIGALLLPLSLAKKIGVIIFFACVYVIFWCWYSGYDWFHFYQNTLPWMKNRLIVVDEAAPIEISFFHPVIILFLIALAFLGHRLQWKNHWALWLVISWFLLTKQLRYMPTVILLLTVVMAHALKTLPVQLLVLQRAGIVVLGLFMLFMYAHVIGSHTFPNFKTLKGNEKILTLGDWNTMLIPVFKPGIQIAPIMEAGASEPRLQNLIKNLHEHKDGSCSEFEHYSLFTHFLESSKQNIKLSNIPTCWELQEINSETRLWKIHRKQFQP